MGTMVSGAELLKRRFLCCAGTFGTGNDDLAAAPLR
jgi:hypothetical protein